MEMTEAMLVARIKAERAKERERCAKLCEESAFFDHSPTGFGRGMAKDLASSIRALQDQNDERKERVAKLREKADAIERGTALLE